MSNCVIIIFYNYMCCLICFKLITHSACAESAAQLDYVSITRTLITQALANLNS